MSEPIQLRYIKRTDQVSPNVVQIEPEVIPNSHSPGGANPSVLDEDGVKPTSGSFANTAFVADGSYETIQPDKSENPESTEIEPVYSTVWDRNGDPPQPEVSGKVKRRGAPVREQTGEDPGCCLTAVQDGQHAMDLFFFYHGPKLKMAVCMLILLGYAAYFGYAMWYSLEGEDQIRLLWITLVAVVFSALTLILRSYGGKLKKVLVDPLTNFIKQRFTLFKWIFIIVFVLLVIIYLIVDVAIPRPRNLVSLTGYIIYIFLLFIFSTDPARVRWRPVCWGLGIQFVFALLTLRTSWGYDAFKWLGDRVSEFLVHTDAGSEFVFGEAFKDHPFAFQVLPVVIFFSTFISVLYYLGVMQFIILKIAWVMQRTLGTSAAESVNAAGNIFIGQTEAPLLIRPLIEDMSPSELHAVMVGGFATIAGSVLATYIMFGVQPNHLITASVMAAPAALGVSKLACPETKRNSSSNEERDTMEKSPQRNVIEAASAGASAAIPLVANIAANLIAFMALLAFINATLEWFGARIGLRPPDYPPLTFQLICSYILWPFAYVMGVDTSDCRKVAELIGFKTFINEFIAYSKLGELITNRDLFNEYLNKYNGSWEWINQDILLKKTGVTLVGGVISPRSVIISTYALCGFANLSSIGMVMGALGAMSEKQKPVIAQLALRAMIAGNVVSMMNACMAGLLYEAT